MDKGMKIGICGGTFDPVHVGHLAVAELVREEFGLDRVLFIPSGKPPHKDLTSVTDPIHRLNMVQCAVSTNPNFEAVSIEVERRGYTYTVDTLKQLHELYPKGTEFYYIIGADVVMDLLKWKSTEEVFTLTRFIALMRPGFQDEEFKTRLTYLKSEYDVNITGFEAPLIEISSTFIRDRIKNGKSVKYFITEPVEGYIKENNLYI
ncbi:nicotinic acid mononucleotide adenylyltransferase [Ruminiclostridium papyrosolvens C7]|uniref:Probable nicotinate-nucleotide adenylyltransferase n=2 Tax=Ruminiclostridium papyrosolvens TaxID=29362 RepID=U4QZ40_9FIRM|nr:nicotinate-nucleotide adenylyltransferase [Ruminiclostridium papyrosolvens]EPR09265.1 nicotinic acid mononucleotide adenylyltransferase [Ruminiclostridium papyrosolvens C7]